MVIFNSRRLMLALIVIAFLVPFGGHSQILDNYVREGLENNIVLQQKSISLDHALYSLKTASSYFLPSSNLQGNYTTGDGGRFIPLPIGDLLNPVYSTLNQMTSSNSFPTIENKEISFFPKDFYDVKLHTTVPIVNTDIFYNKKIRKHQVELKEYELDAYKRELIRNIKTAYFNFLSASKSVQIFNSAVDILVDNVRINHVLIKNGKGLKSSYLRSQSEKEMVLVQLNNARNDAENAKKYFNYLLNKDLLSEIDTSFIIEDFKMDSLMNSLVLLKNSSREELKMLEIGENISQLVVKMNRASLTPKIGGFIDIGMQAENWSFDSKARYYLAGIQIDVPIFNGGKNNFKIKQSVLDFKNAQLNRENNTQQLSLANEIAKSNLSSAWQAYQASIQQVKSSRSYFNLVEKGYMEGINLQIEFLDARNQLTSSELMLIINKYKVMTEIANVEREIGSYDLSNLENRSLKD